MFPNFEWGSKGIFNIDFLDISKAFQTNTEKGVYVDRIVE